jgi:DNA repair protein SbcC/Rad50
LARGDRLSIGTAEQIYLLLRFALAQHLATTDETCPLLLDDVTVQADDGRTCEVLDPLLRLSADRQVILFAQEPVVAEWAHANLNVGENSIIELSLIDVEYTEPQMLSPRS